MKRFGSRSGALLYGGLATSLLGVALVLFVALVLPSQEAGREAGGPEEGTRLSARPADSSILGPDPEAGAGRGAQSSEDVGTAGSSSGPDAGGGAGPAPPPVGTPTLPEGQDEPPPVEWASPPGDGSSDPEATLRQAQGRAGYQVLRLSDPEWLLSNAVLARVGDADYLDSTYRRAEDFLNLSQGPAAELPVLPVAEEHLVRGQPAHILDMGALEVVHWTEAGSRLTATSDAGRPTLLALLEGLEPLD